jgi:two-component system NarL family sensor kinase
MPLKLKLIFLTLIPLLVVTASISWITAYQAKTLGNNEVELFRAKLIESREFALKDSVDLAFDAISHVYYDSDLNVLTAQEEVKAILNKLTYGENGYFFVYDQDGTNLVHPILPELIGQNLVNLQDNNGDFLIQTLLDKARGGGGYHEYLWQKPSTGEIVPKLSYAAWLDKWDWMIGTGLYIEDISYEIAQLELAINNNIETTIFSIVTILSVTVAVIIVITLAINMHEHRIADKNLKELAHKTVMFQEDEKKHLSRELHDGINQLLVSSKCHLDLLEHHISAPSSMETIRSTLSQSQHSLITAIAEVRHISHNLRPTALDDIGLQAALTSLLQDFETHSGIPVDAHLNTQAGKLTSEKSTTMYRVAQETLTNIEKHASASLVTVGLRQMGDLLQLIIKDDGVGFESNIAVENRGIGLRNMRERVEFIGGEFELFSELGHGTEVTVLIKVS